ncbi:DUF5683 domain-containing protein [Lewinella cohaerens]|uniref:DUF5683 domain-containing protein n=1 Tax=Lewinella cohaerens TaxID=70995 RepID=UPI00036AC536|nr:DUF5683 domain-containing protein [Lewinella cohaerens]
MPHWKKYCWVLLCLLGQQFSGLSQEVDSLPTANQSLAREVDLALTIQEPRVYVPRTALMWSIVPGGGQIYNRRWWKVPLVFSAFSGVFAVLDFNQSNYQRFRDAYQLELAGEEHEFSSRGYDASRLLVFRDNFNKSRQTNYFMLLAVYLLQGVEAYVDTHLRNFDMDEDLSQWQVMPVIIPAGVGQSPNVVLQVQYSF